MTEKDYKYYLEEGIKKTNEGKFEEALENLEKSLELKPDHALTHFSKGIAYHNGWITSEKLRELAQPMLKNQYGQYLMKLADTKYFGEMK